MIEADHISLASGQSYQHASIFTPADYQQYGVDRIFGDLTLAILAEGRLMRINLWNLRVIALDRRRRGGRNCIPFDRLILEKDIVYTNGVVINRQDYAEVGVPMIISGGLTQFTWATDVGTSISHDANVVSLITKDPRGGNTDKVVIRSGLHINPDTSTPVIQGRILRRHT